MKNKSNIVLAILIIMFIIITILMMNNLTIGIDGKVFKFISSFRCNSLTKFFKIISELANVNFCIILIISFVIALRNIYGLLLAVTAIDVEILNLILKFIIKRERPDITNHLVNVSNYSYPSGHSMMSMALYGYFIYLIWNKVKTKKLKYCGVVFFSILILLIGISRIYLGVHYFTDVVAGFIASLIYLIVLDKIIKLMGVKDV